MFVRYVRVAVGSLLLACASACAPVDGEDENQDDAPNETADIGASKASLTGPLVSPAGCVEGDFQQLGPNGITLSGTWRGANAVASLRVNGTNVSVNPSTGAWSTQVPAFHGLNAYVAESRDTAGNVFRNICSVYGGITLLSSDTKLQNAILLGLRDGDLDDGAPDSPLGSVADALRRALASEMVRAEIEMELRAGSPYRINDNREYAVRGFSYDSATVNISSAANALRARLEVRGVRVNGKAMRDRAVLDDTATTLDLKIASIIVEQDIRVVVDSNGVATASIETDTGMVSISKPEAEGDGFRGEIIDGVVNWFLTDNIRSALRKGVKRALNKSAATQISHLMSQIAPTVFKTTSISIPNIGRSGSTQLNADVRLQTATAVPRGAFRVGFSTKISSPQAKTAEGVLIDTLFPPAWFLEQYDPATCSASCQQAFTNRSAAAVSFGVANQAMLALWQADFFNVPDMNTAFNMGLAPGSTFSLKFKRPPMVHGVPGTSNARLSMGPVAVDVNVPGGMKLRADMYLVVKMGMQVASTDKFRFTSVAIEAAEIDMRNQNIANIRIAPAEANAMIVAISGVISRAMNGIDLFQIPSFKIPSSLASAGLPAGSKVGVLSPLVGDATTHVLLSGNLGQF